MKKKELKIRDNNLYEFLKDFALEVLNYFKENKSLEKVQKVIIKQYDPIFTFDEKEKIKSFDEREEEKIDYDYRFFVYEYEDYITKLESFKKIIDYLKANNKSIGRIEILLIEFLSSYLVLERNFDFNLKSFNAVFLSFEKIIFQLPNKIITYAIIPGLQIDDNSLKLNNNISIKPFNVDLFNLVFSRTKEKDYLRLMLLACNGTMSFIEITTNEIIESDFLPALMNHVDLIRDLVLCLRLFKEGDIFIINYVQNSNNLVVDSGGTMTFGNRVPVSSIKKQFMLNRDEFNDFRHFYKSFILAKSGFQGFINLAISRFNGIWFRKGYEDIIVDLIIAFESLFLSNNPEMSFRLAYSVAHFIGNNSLDRKNIYTNMKKAYVNRSKIVHGSSSKGKSKSFAETENILLSLQSYFRLVIQKMISDKSYLTNKNDFLKKIEDIILK